MRIDLFSDKINLKGHIRITDFDTKKIIVDTDNHIVISGRRWLMQRMFNMPITQDSNAHTWLPGWFGIGSGGASVDAPFIPIWPTDDDTSLFYPEEFSQEGAQYSATNHLYKMVDSISFPNDLTAKLTMTLDYQDMVDKYINEAGMFVGEVLEYTNENFLMFSHVTFPTFPKSIYQKLTLEWFFMF